VHSHDIYGLLLKATHVEGMYAMRYSLILILVLGFVLQLPAGSKHRGPVSKKEAIALVRGEAANDSISAPRLVKNGKHQYWEMKAGTGTDSQIYRVETRNGVVTRVDSQVAAAVPAAAFGSVEEIALRKIPGTVMSTVHGERNGKQISTVRIQTKNGKIVDVDVDEVSRKIDRIQTED